MQKKWIAGGLLVLGLLGMCGCSSQAFVSEQQTETVLTQEETGWEFQDGTYQVEVELLGGSGRASVTSPAKVEIKDGKAVATLEWSSPNYDYMVVDGEKYLPVNTEGNSVFQIPVEAFDQDIAVIADTVAMSTPHEIEYTLNFHAGGNGQNAAKADTTGQEDADGAEKGQQTAAVGGNPAKTAAAPLTYDHSMELSYAENFAVDYYEGGYKLLTTRLNGDRILIVPKHQQAPEDAEALVSPSAEGKPGKLIVLQEPVKNLYLVASSVMDMFAQLDSMDAISMCGLKEEDWYIPAAKQAMKDGTLLYAGKYSQPDYELLLSQNCSMAIENSMIYHTPEVMEKLEEFGIPTLVEYSSYEEHPLGRVEWVRFFGALLDQEEKADQLFEKQKEALKRVEAEESTGKTVAFFYITSNGLVQVRQSTDYIPKMIELAGGKYVFENLGDPDSRRSTVNLQLEDFYDGAQDADFLVYNTTIDRQVQTLEDLLKKCSLLKDFKAVKNHQVWCTTEDMYQQSMSAGNLIEDFHRMLTGDDKETRYLYRLK
ncbi:iron compound ABC transporter periplasmic iron compound-binding protein putative [Firmicutes bacterium CAG:24]|nr:iron compound ABC transporter periplasmic iron compound-binding protein putative [Firmicutes bacterium CAG:24]